MGDLYRRIRERKIVQWLIVYMTGGWAITEVIDTLAVSVFSLPTLRPALLMALALGVPVVLVLAWYHGEKGRQRVSGTELIILVALFAVLGGVMMLIDRGPRSPPPMAEADFEPAPAIAVLPSISSGPGAEETGDAIVSVLSSGLDAIPGWRAVSERTVRARWSERLPDGTTADEATALQIARATDATWAVLPTTTVLGSTVRVSADIYDLREVPASPRSIEGSGPADDILAISDGLAVEILGAVLQGEGQIPDIDLSRTTSQSPQALRAFLQGEVAYREFRLEDARDAFNLALEHDPSFSRAHYRLIEVHTWGVTQNGPLLAQHRSHALEGIDRLSEREALVLRGITGEDLPTRLRLLREAVARYPDDATAWNLLGERLVHGLGALADAADIETAFATALQLDPGRAVLYPHVVDIPFNLHSADSARAAQLVDAFTKAASGVTGPPMPDLDPRGGHLALAVVFGDSVSREAAAARLVAGADEGDVSAIAAIGYLHHPRNYDVARPALTRVLDRDLGPLQPRMRLLDGDLQSRGRIERGLSTLGDGTLSRTVSEALHDAAIMGIPIPADLLHRLFGPDRITSDTEVWRLVRAGVLAAAEGRWSDHQRAVDILKTAIGPDGDRVLPEFADAYGAIRRGEAASALPVLTDLTSSGRAGARIAIWVLGETYMELGRWADAERVFRAAGMDEGFRHFSPLPLVRLRLAESLEAQGKAAEAVEAYAYFAEAWAGADPELQPMVQRALDAIARLSPDRGR